MSRAAKGVWNAFLSGFLTSEISLWEGEAPAEPKLLANREVGKSAGQVKIAHQ